MPKRVAEVIPSATFLRELKPLAKKFASLLTEVAELGERLARQPQTGTPLGNNCYKIRLAVRSKGTGKRGGMRVVTHVVALRQNEEVYLLTIYDKSAQANYSDAQLRAALAEITELRNRK